MRRKVLIGVLCAAALLAATAVGGGLRVKTTLSFDSYQEIAGNEAFIVGSVRSSRGRCKQLRRVRLTGRDFGSSERELLGIDSAQSSKVQYRIATPPPDLIRLVAKRKRFRSGLICKASRSAEFATPRAFAGRRGNSNVSTKVEIIASRINPDNENPAQFDANGKVKSAKGKCERNRTVRLYRVRPGADQLEGKDRTSRRGNWFIAGDVPGTSANGTIYAKTRKAKRGSTTCSGDRSPNHVINQDV